MNGYILIIACACIVALLMLFLLASSSHDNSGGGSWIASLIVVGSIVVCCVYLGEAAYRHGQIDAANGRQYFELRANADQTTEWVERPTTQPQQEHQP